MGIETNKPQNQPKPEQHVSPGEHLRQAERRADTFKSPEPKKPAQPGQKH